MHQPPRPRQIHTALPRPRVDTFPINALVRARLDGYRLELGARPAEREQGDVGVALDGLAEDVEAVVWWGFS